MIESYFRRETERYGIRRKFRTSFEVEEDFREVTSGERILRDFLISVMEVCFMNHFMTTKNKGKLYGEVRRLTVSISSVNQ